MDEHRCFAKNSEPPEFEEKAELLRRETAEEMLGQSQKQGSGGKGGSVKSGSKARSEAAGSGKGKSRNAKTGKTAVETEKRSSSAKNKDKFKSEDSSQNTAGKNHPKKGVSERLASELIGEKPLAGKRAAKKPVQAEEQSAEQQDNQQAADDGANRVSCKTPQVMKLIEDDSSELVIYAGKSRVPKLLRGKESLSRLSRRNAADDEIEVVNITELVIRYEAADILDRFNACSCEKCVQVFSEIISRKIPVRYARISRSELEMGGLPERAIPMRKIVLPEMIRELICNKKRCFHDK